MMAEKQPKKQAVPKTEKVTKGRVLQTPYDRNKFTPGRQNNPFVTSAVGSMVGQEFLDPHYAAKQVAKWMQENRFQLSNMDPAEVKKLVELHFTNANLTQKAAMDQYQKGVDKYLAEQTESKKTNELTNDKREKIMKESFAYADQAAKYMVKDEGSFWEKVQKPIDPMRPDLGTTQTDVLYVTDAVTKKPRQATQKEQRDIYSWAWHDARKKYLADMFGQYGYDTTGQNKLSDIKAARDEETKRFEGTGWTDAQIKTLKEIEYVRKTQGDEEVNRRTITATAGPNAGRKVWLSADLMTEQPLPGETATEKQAIPSTQKLDITPEYIANKFGRGAIEPLSETNTDYTSQMPYIKDLKKVAPEDEADYMRRVREAARGRALPVQETPQPVMAEAVANPYTPVNAQNWRLPVAPDVPTGLEDYAGEDLSLDFPAWLRPSQQQIMAHE
jgi:hypothetical protein